MADAPENEEKTEEATPRRREEARERGQVAFSSELMAGVMLTAAVFAMYFAGPALGTSFGALVRNSAVTVREGGTGELTAPGVAALVERMGYDVLPAMLLLIVPVVVVGLIVGFSQIGFRITPSAIAFNPGKLNPLQGMKKVFSMRGVVRTGLAAAKILLVIGVVSAATWMHVPGLSAMTGTDIGPMLSGAGLVISRITYSTLAVIIVLAVLDVLYQRFQHGRDLRMSKKEMREEHKSTEGDPHVRARIRQIQREMATKRMMGDVPDATVVVTNPTHFAVALKYAEQDGGAPRVVAKGVDEVAQKIKSVARDAGVLVYEDPPLARALHRQVEIGDEIPEDLFQAVASILAYVYRVQGGEAPPGGKRPGQASSQAPSPSPSQASGR